MSTSAHQKYLDLGLQLPPAPAPVGLYKPMLVNGHYVYVSGHGPVREDKSLIKGRIGQNMNEDEGRLAARQVGLTILSTLIAGLGTLDKVKRVIKVFGMVNCSADFMRHPHVINGCSEVFAQIWGEEEGIGTRSAVGMGSLPDNIAVEIEAIFELA